MENKKYELLTNGTIMIDGRTLYCIRALKDFGSVIAGDLGGYVEGYHNLSHDGGCWIYDNAKVYGDAMVFDNAMVYGNARIYGDARVFDYATVRDDARVCGNAKVFDGADVCGNSKVFDGAEVYGYAIVRNDAVVCNAKVFDYAVIYNTAGVYGGIVHDNASVCGDANIYENSNIYGNAIIRSDVRITNNADISSNKDYLFIRGLGSHNRPTTAYRLSDGNIYVNCGCFKGTLDAFESKVNVTHGDNKYGKEYKMLIDMCKLHFELI